MPSVDTGVHFRRGGHRVTSMGQFLQSAWYSTVFILQVEFGLMLNIAGDVYKFVSLL